MLLEDIVEEYKDKCRPLRTKELEYFKGKSIKIASSGKYKDEKKHSHQKRLKESALENGSKILYANREQLKKCKDFDELHRTVKQLIDGNKDKDEDENTTGLGPLYIYDTSLRIASKLSIGPESVYLHAGALEGAKKLMGIIGDQEKLEINKFPKELQVLKAHEIENLLCLYKDNF